MTQQQLNATGYVVLTEEKSIEPITYRKYLNKYGQDYCTSPRGVCHRHHIREGGHSDAIEYQIWSWGTLGNHPYYTGNSFDNLEDAQLYIYQTMERHVEKDWDAPHFFFNYEEAVSDMASFFNKGEDVIRRYFQMLRLRL